MNIFRIRVGNLDLIAAILFLLGVYLTANGNNNGWILIAFGLVKQFSGV